MKRAREWNNREEPVVIEDDVQEIPESKAATRDAIDRLMRDMNTNELIEIFDDDSDIDEIQSVIGDTDDNNEMNDTDTFLPEPAPSNAMPTIFENSQENFSVANAKGDKVMHLACEHLLKTNESNQSEIEHILSNIHRFVPEKYQCSFVSIFHFFCYSYDKNIYKFSFLSSTG